MNTTLPTDSKERKDYALFRGCLNYFPAALAGVAKTSKLGNDKHNPGQEMHHDRSKSKDHADCVLRHLLDLNDLLAATDRGENISKDALLTEVSSLAWRALALSQELHEKLGYPIAPGAKFYDKKETPENKTVEFNDIFNPDGTIKLPDQFNMPIYGRSATGIPLSAVELYNAGEYAQEKVKEMVETNKKEIFNIVKPNPVTELVQLEKPKKKFTPGDVVKHLNNDVEVVVEGMYYDEHGKAVLFVRDSNNEIFAVDPNSYKSIYVERKTSEGN